VKYLLDTCVLSELTKPQPSPRVIRWLEGVDEHQMGISVLTVGELEKGIERLATSKRKRALRSWLDELIAGYDQKILGITLEIAAEWGRMSAAAELKGQSLPVVDGLIAATARARSLVVVTRNSADMQRTGAQLVDPWAEQ
jgi:predicted nucleic acid-binding protein